NDRRGVTLLCQQGGAQKRFRTRLLIGADGSSSVVARCVRGAKPPRRDVVVAVRAYFERVEGIADQGDLYVDSSTFPGYAWLFPTGSDTANVGVGMALENYVAKGQQLGRLLTRIVRSNPALRCRLANARMCGAIVGWPLATYNPRSPVVADR